MSATARSGRVPRWGMPDALWCWMAGFVGAQVAFVAAWAGGADVDSTALLFAIVIPAQYAATVGCALLVSRAKGAGSLATDFGWRIRRSHWPAVLAGAGLQYVALVALLPIARLAGLDHEPQQLVERTRATHSLPLIALIVVATAVAAPAVEELIFRGVLLRALLRRTSDGWAITISALVFALAHLFDPGAAYVFPGLFGLGLVLATVAVRDRSLSRPILIHSGFNLLATTLTLLRL